MRIIIVGAGIGGLTLANLLQNDNHELIIVEKARLIEPVGYAVGVWKNGTDVLNKLGLLQEFKNNSFIAQFQKTYTPSGKLLRTTCFSNLNKKFGDAIRFIHRADLYKILYNNLKTNKYKIHLNSTVSQLSQKDNIVYVTLSNGEMLQADFLIGADGVNSSIRQLIFPNEDCIKKHEVIFSTFTVNNCLSEPLMGTEEIIGKGTFIGIYPYSENKYGIYASLKHSLDEPIKNDITKIKENFKNFGEKVDAIFNSVNENTSVFSDYIREISLAKWYHEKVILIGDAAHALLPTTGQGLSAAMEDAYELHKAIFAETDEKDIENKLKKFQKKRSTKLKPVIRDSRLNHYMIMNKYSLICKLRDLAIQFLPNSEKKLAHFFKHNFDYEK
jgi:2-polyprenyl-6-methoxyphenol hydroxylase-like FAD-dependent oxidoreductase